MFSRTCKSVGGPHRSRRCQLCAVRSGQHIWENHSRATCRFDPCLPMCMRPSIDRTSMSVLKTALMMLVLSLPSSPEAKGKDSAGAIGAPRAGQAGAGIGKDILIASGFRQAEKGLDRANNPACNLCIRLVENIDKYVGVRIYLHVIPVSSRIECIKSQTFPI